MHRIWLDFISLFFPMTCTGCDEALLGTEEILCSKCLANLPKTFFVSQPTNNSLYTRLMGRVELKHAYAYLYFTKGGMVQHMLHRLKYHGRKDVGHKLGLILADEIKKQLPNHAYDLIVPVPLHETRLRRRGFNQSTCFAEGISAGLQIPYNEKALKRVTPTQTQTKRSRIKRWDNVKEVFLIENKEELKNKNVLLVDDVVTTGATLEACAHELLKHAASVSIATIATAR
ncbi:MAG TPA: ComF family protein [Cyclobacteriaceae bacterium]|nr:ComF family protein [Cyclobacteriaceae bacterium]